MPEPVLTAIPPDVVALSDYEPLAHARMSAGAQAWLEGGATDERTLRDNLAAFARLRLRNRVLRDLSGGHTRLELLGQTFEHPILVAPVAQHGVLHPDGERATALGAAALGAGLVVSTQSSLTLEEIARAEHGPLWFQLYIQPDRDFTRDLVWRAEAAGYGALVLTVDAPVSGLRNREQRSGFALPEAVNLRGMRGLPPQVARPGQSPLLAGALIQTVPTWRDVDWLLSLTRLPVLLKGILAPDDAREAVRRGAGGIIVSNHGGRTLDTLPATLDALPAVARAVEGRAPVLMDGGIRRGTDVLKALALGADAVLVGRPCMHGLAAAGAIGVAHVLHILRTEFEIAMALTGCRTLEDIDANVLYAPDV